MLLLLLAACSPYRAECVSLRIDEDLDNHTQPFQIALDATARRVYSSSLANPNLAVIDADTGELIAVKKVSDQPLKNPDLAVDERGATTTSYTTPKSSARCGTSPPAIASRSW